MTEDTKAKIKQLADDYAHCYAFVGDDTMPLKRTELHAAIDSIDARGEAVAPALRVLFEEWAERDEYPLHKRQNGEYSYPPTQSAWRIWQAAAGAAALRYAAPLCASQDGVGEQQGGPYAIHRDAIADRGSLQEKVAEESFPASQDGGGAGKYMQIPDDVFDRLQAEHDCFDDPEHGRYTRIHDFANGVWNAALRSPLPGRESTAQSAFAGATRLALSDDMTYDRDGNLVAADDTESESTAQAGIAQSFGPVINPPTVLTTTAGVDTRTVCGTAQAGAGDPRCSDCPARWPGSKWAAAPTVLAMREALQGLLDAHARNTLFSGAGHWDAARAALASPLPEPRAGEAEFDWWYDLAQRHVNADWNSDQPDGYINAVKALVLDALAASPIPPSEPQEGREP